MSSPTAGDASERLTFWVQRVPAGAPGGKAEALLGVTAELVYQVCAESAHAAAALYGAIQQAQSAYTESTRRRAAWRARVAANVAAQFLGALRTPRGGGVSPAAAAAPPAATPRDRTGADTSELYADGTLRKRGQREREGRRQGGGGAEPTGAPAAHDEGSLLARGRRRSVNLVMPVLNLFKEVQQGGSRGHTPQQTPRQPALPPLQHRGLQDGRKWSGGKF